MEERRAVRRCMWLLAIIAVCSLIPAIGTHEEPLEAIVTGIGTTTGLLASLCWLLLALRERKKRKQADQRLTPRRDHG